jgi:phospholipase/carboxylesterase
MTLCERGWRWQAGVSTYIGTKILEAVMSTYHFRQTDTATPSAPLFVVFHGTGGDENQFFDVARQLLPDARVVAPRGDVSEGGALRYFRRTGEGVYDMPDLATRTAAMIAFVRERVGEGTPSDVIGLGYSNGANILANMLFEAPDLFSAAILMHPLIPFEPKPQPGLAGIPVLITAGRRDPIAPGAATERLAGYFDDQGAKTSTVWHDGGHELRQEELLATQQFLVPFRRREA